jgi:hypothetical protein
MMTIQEGINLFVPVKYRHKSVKMQYPAYIKHLQNKKKHLWHRRHYHCCRVAYNKVNMKCRQAIEQFHVRRESELSILDSKKFFARVSKKLKSHSSILAMRDDNGATITNDLDEANGFVMEF